MLKRHPLLQPTPLQELREMNRELLATVQEQGHLIVRLMGLNVKTLEMYETNVAAQHRLSEQQKNMLAVLSIHN